MGVHVDRWWSRFARLKRCFRVTYGETVKQFSSREAIIYVSATLTMLLFTVAAFRSTTSWNDFWSLIGSGTGLFGILVAIEQTLQTKTAAVAAQEASQSTSSQMRGEYYRFALLDAKRLFSEGLAFVHSQKWTLASLRLRDTADRLSHLAYSGPDVDEGWEEATKAIRWWADVFSHGTNKKYKYDNASWIDRCAQIQKKIDMESGPFQSEESGEQNREE